MNGLGWSGAVHGWQCGAWMIRRSLQATGVMEAWCMNSPEQPAGGASHGFVKVWHKAKISMRRPLLLLLLMALLRLRLALTQQLLILLLLLRLTGSWHLPATCRRARPDL